MCATRFLTGHFFEEKLRKKQKAGKAGEKAAVKVLWGKTENDRGWIHNMVDMQQDFVNRTMYARNCYKLRAR
jgi:hypothetical protein